MSTDEFTCLEDAVYARAQLAFNDATAKAEAVNGRIYLYVGPICLSLTPASTRTVIEMLDDALVTAEGADAYGPVRTFKLLVDDSQRTAGLKLVTE